MELYYEISSFFYLIVLNGMTAACFVRMVKPFLRDGVKVWQVGAAYFIMMELLQYMPWYISNFTAYSLGIFVSFFVMYLLDRKNVEQKIFLCVTFFSLRWLSFTMENCIGKEYFRLSVKLLINTKNIWMQFGIFVADCVQEIILGFLFLECEDGVCVVNVMLLAD